MFRRKPNHMKRILLLLLIFAALAACNVTRTVTTKSEYFSRGDTTITITTRTVESYDAVKR